MPDWNVSSTGKVLTHPVGWARVLNPLKPGHCGLCVVCAARGPVYSSRKTALTRDGTLTRRYHDRCTCIVVPVFSSRAWPGRDQWLELKDVYEREVTAKKLTGAQARTAMDTWSRGDRTAEKKSRAAHRKTVEKVVEERG